MNQKVLFVAFMALFALACRDEGANQTTAKMNARVTDTIPWKNWDSSLMSVKSLLEEITLDQAATLIYYHKTNRLPQLRTAIGKEDTRYIHFRLDELMKYLKEVHQNYKADSVRIYFGVYSNSSSKPERRNCQTILFVPTLGGEDILSQGNIPTFAYNEGQLCPPPEPCNPAGAKLLLRVEDPEFDPIDW